MYTELYALLTGLVMLIRYERSRTHGKRKEKDQGPVIELWFWFEIPRFRVGNLVLAEGRKVQRKKIVIRTTKDEHTDPNSKV